MSCALVSHISPNGQLLPAAAIEAEQVEGVNEPLAGALNLKVEVRAGRAAGRAHEADNLPGYDVIACLHSLRAHDGVSVLDGVRARLDHDHPAQVRAWLLSAWKSA